MLSPCSKWPRFWVTSMFDRRKIYPCTPKWRQIGPSTRSKGGNLQLGGLILVNSRGFVFWRGSGIYTCTIYINLYRCDSIFRKSMSPHGVGRVFVWVFQGFLSSWSCFCSTSPLKCMCSRFACAWICLYCLCLAGKTTNL